MIQAFLNLEFVKYAISGGVITVTNFAVFYGLTSMLGIHYTVANIAALILSKLVGYVLNKLWVFKSRTEGLWNFLKEFAAFFATRGFTGLVDYFGLILLVEVFGFNKLLCKGFLMVFVIVLNYILGKFLVFRKEKGMGESGQEGLQGNG